MMDTNKTWEKIQNKFENILSESETELNDDEYKDLQNILDGGLDDLYSEMDLIYNSKKIYVEKIHPDAIIPSYAYPTDSGFDLCSVEKIVIPPNSRIAVPTGLKLEFDENHELQIRPKSGLALNYGLTVLNTPGTIDQGYSGEIKVIVFNTNNLHVVIEKGMKIAQAVLCPVINGKYVIFEQVDSLSEKDRGSNGFGSTGI